MAAMDTSGDGPPGFGAEATSEELILELFDVLERCPADARDAATDAALEAVLAVAPPPPKVEGEEDAADGAADDDAGDASVASSSRLSKTEGMDFVRPPSAYDRYRDAMRAAVSREHPDLEPLAINEKLRAQWATLSEEEKEPYVVEARGERDAFEARRQQQLYGDDEPWEADRPRRPATVFDLWSRAAKPREKMPAGAKEATIRKRITALYAALDPEERKPYDEEFARTSAAHIVAEKAWAEKWGLVKCYKGYVPKTDPAAVAQAERLRKQGAAAASAQSPPPPQPKKPLSAYNAWRRKNVKAVREANPTLPHGKLEKKLNALYKAIEDDERKPYEDAARAEKERWKADCAAWTAMMALREAEAGDDSDDGEAPSAPPPAYPKAPDLWCRDEKDAWKAKFPELAPIDLSKKMKAHWSSLPDDNPVKAEYKQRSAGLREEYARKFEAWSRRKSPEPGPRKRRKTAAASESADSILSRAAHFTPLQRSLLEARRALTSRRPDDENALANGNRAHETLAREFAADLWRQDGLKPNQSESQPSQEILKHYYTKIANWLKRRPKATDDD